MNDLQRAKAPLHLWIVGILALLWNCIGPYDYVMTRTRNIEYFKKMMPTVDPQALLAWIDAFPIWAQFGWGLGVWLGLAGSILLLLRHRWAVPAFALSLFGAILGLGYQIVAAPPLAGAEGIEYKVMPFVIILVAALLLFYAHRQRQRGVLR